MPGHKRGHRTDGARRVLIVDDHPLIRRGLTALVDGEDDLVVCGEAGSHREGVAAVASTRPDLVIADLPLGDGDGLAMVREIRARYPELPILILTMHAALGHAQRAFGAGASGYVSKQEIGETVLKGARRVLNGGRYVSPKVLADPRSS